MLKKCIFIITLLISISKFLFAQEYGVSAVLYENMSTIPNQKAKILLQSEQTGCNYFGSAIAGTIPTRKGDLIPYNQRVLIQIYKKECRMGDGTVEKVKMTGFVIGDDLFVGLLGTPYPRSCLSSQIMNLKNCGLILIRGTLGYIFNSSTVYRQDNLQLFNQSMYTHCSLAVHRNPKSIRSDKLIARTLFYSSVALITYRLNGVRSHQEKIMMKQLKDHQNNCLRYSR